MDPFLWSALHRPDSEIVTEQNNGHLQKNNVRLIKVDLGYLLKAEKSIQVILNVSMRVL